MGSCEYEIAIGTLHFSSQSVVSKPASLTFHSKLLARLLISCFFACGIQPLFGQYDSDEKKAKFYLELCKKYSPDAFEILNSDTAHSFTRYASKGITALDLLSDINTVVHETCHGYNWILGTVDGWNHDGFFISTKCKIGCKKGSFFKSSVLNDVVPLEQQQKIFRYKTYVSGESDNSSTLQGVYGFVDEFAAYYHGSKIDLELLPYYETLCPYSDAQCWVRKYLSNVESTLYAYYEFRLFIAWYLIYAEQYEKKTFDELISNQNLRLAFTLLEVEFKKLIDNYFLTRQKVVEKMTNAGVKIKIDSEYINIVEGNGSSGNGIPDDDIAYLKTLYTAKENLMLERFRIKGATLANFKSFVVKSSK